MAGIYAKGTPVVSTLPLPWRTPRFPRMHRVFRTVAATVVPEAAQLDAAGWAELERIVERALGDRPVVMRRKLMAFLRVVEWIPLLRYGRRFSTLDSARRERLLSAFEHAPLLLLRRGFWGVRTLVFMGYYGRPAAAAAIGYRADPRGWDARR